MIKKVQVMVTEEEITSVWGNSDFGTMTKIDVVKYGLLKCASGYYQGHTSRCILKELGLITEKYNMTKRGRFCLYEFFSNKVSI
jgi:hypothetical protein